MLCTVVCFLAGAALGSAFGGIAALVGTPLGLQVTQPQAYALVGVAGMLAALCQVTWRLLMPSRCFLTRMFLPH